MTAIPPGARLSLFGRAVPGPLALALALAWAAAAQDRPDLSGSWRLQAKASDDGEAKVEAAAGTGQVRGGGEGETQRLLPSGSARSEVERVQLRARMLELLSGIDALDIEQTADQIKIDRGEDFRIHYFGREHVRSDAQGRRLQCRSQWKGTQLVLEQQGEDKLRLIEVLTLLPEGKRLLDVVRFEHARLREPLELKLVYDRAEGR